MGTSTPPRPAALSRDKVQVIASALHGIYTRALAASLRPAEPIRVMVPPELDAPAVRCACSLPRTSLPEQPRRHGNVSRAGCGSWPAHCVSDPSLGRRRVLRGQASARASSRRRVGWFAEALARRADRPGLARPLPPDDRRERLCRLEVAGPLVASGRGRLACVSRRGRSFARRARAAGDVRPLAQADAARLAGPHIAAAGLRGAAAQPLLGVDCVQPSDGVDGRASSSTAGATSDAAVGQHASPDVADRRRLSVASARSPTRSGAVATWPRGSAGRPCSGRAQGSGEGRAPHELDRAGQRARRANGRSRRAFTRHVLQHRRVGCIADAR